MFHLSYLAGKSFHDNAGSQKCLNCQSIYITLVITSGNTEATMIRNGKDCQMKSVSLLIHQVAVLL